MFLVGLSEGQHIAGDVPTRSTLTYVLHCDSKHM